MSFLFLRALVCNLFFLVIILTRLRSLFIKVSVAPCYVPSDFPTMPVTTRSQARYLQNISHECSIFSSPGSLVNNPSSLLSPAATSTCNYNPTTLLGHDTPTVNSSEFAKSTIVHSSIASSSLEFENPSEISKFQIENISNTALFEPGSCHNSSILKSSIMEADCEELGTMSSSLPDIPDMNKIFEALSGHFTMHTNRLQERFQQVVDTHDDFKMEVRQELDNVRSLIQDQNTQQVSSIGTTPVVKTQVDSSPTSQAQVSSPGVGVALNTTASTPPDLQFQMLQMLTESFSKLSTALTDKSNDSKAEWPKFSGDGKKFRAWYLAIMSQLSLPPWLELYNQTMNDVVRSTTNVPLNGKLYSKIILALEGIALQNAVSRKHLRANGLLLLQDLVQTYKPRNVPEVIAAKTGEFWSNMKRFPSESVDSYYNRFHELLDDLADAEEPVSTRSAIRHFIFTLGPEFEPIQNNFRIGNLPEPWKTQDWPSLLVLCRDYYNSVKPTLPNTGRKHPQVDTPFDKAAHQKKIRE
jgi:hypothetical protein